MENMRRRIERRKTSDNLPELIQLVSRDEKTEKFSFLWFLQRNTIYIFVLFIHLL